MSKLAIALVIVVAVIAVGGFVTYKVIDKAVDEQKDHAEWDYRLDDNQNGSSMRKVTYTVAVKNVEKDDTKIVKVLCSSFKVKCSDDCTYSVKESTNTGTVSLATKDGYVGMGPGVSVKMNETKQFTITFEVPKNVTVRSLEVSQHGTSFEFNKNLL